MEQRFTKPRYASSSLAGGTHGRWRPLGGNRFRKPGRGNARGFDSFTFRHAPLAEWLSTGFLLRGAGFDPLAAHVCNALRALDALLGLLSPWRRVRFPGNAPPLPLAQRMERLGPNETVPGSNPGRETRGQRRRRLSGRAPYFYCGLWGFESLRRHLLRWRSQEARWAHVPKVRSSNLLPAPNVPVAQQEEHRLGARSAIG
jgi:hypothetical protein